MVLPIIPRNLKPENYKNKFQFGYLSVDRGLLTGINDRVAESAEQDQTARVCGLILLYTLREINPCSRTA